MLEELATYGHNAITRMHNRQRNDAGDKRLDLLKKHAKELQNELSATPDAEPETFTDDFIEPEKCYDANQIEKSWQLKSFEQYGWFYKE